jgi:hypothetical protein
MRLSSAVGLGGIGLCFVGALVALGAGCSSSGSSGSNGGSGGDTCQSAGVQCTVQPAAPSGSMPTSATHNYAMYTLYLGDTDRTGVTNSTAWESYGYNLDNLVTTKSSTDVCTLAAGASKTTQVDGKGGIDNSFGENIMPILQMLDSSASTTLNTDISAGKFTIMTVVNGFDDSAGNTTSATGLSGVLLAGGDYTKLSMGRDGGPPGWDVNTHWPIISALLACGMNGATCPSGSDPISNALVKFPMAFQTGGEFVNGAPSQITLTLAVAGQMLSLKIDSAVISFKPSMPGAVTDGTIAGVLNTMDLVNGLMSIAGNFGICGGTAFQSIAQQIETASDIILDDSTGAVTNTAGTACNAISIGLGFDSTEIALPASADIEAPSDAGIPNPCADGGS